jgi:fused signal recognition particle receptor
MEQFDILALVESLLSNDYAFYGLAGVAALLVLLLAWRLIAVRHKREEDETTIELLERPIERVLTEQAVEERVDEPVINGLPAEEPDDGQDEVLNLSRSSDTVEVFRNLSTGGEKEKEEFKIRPVGRGDQKRIIVEGEPKPVAVVEEPEPDLELEPEPEPLPEAPTPKSLEEGLAKTKGGFIARLNRMVLGKKKIDDSVFEELEEILYSADIGPTATTLFDTVAEQCKRKELKDPAKIRELLREEIYRMLSKAEKPFELDPGKKPSVILMVGVNGVGKTTTIGKLAKKFQMAGKHVILAAGDTFRAAAVEQLAVWGQRAQVEVIKAKEGANPSGVVYSAVEAAVAREADLLIADTAGRLHTKFNLMEELRKMKAVTAKALGREPDETWLVIDANTGQNAVVQAQKFHEALGLTGLVLTKLDGTAKGGVVIGITDQLGLPIRYIGIGEGVEDLRPFDAKAFVDALF